MSIRFATYNLGGGSRSFPFADLADRTARLARVINGFGPDVLVAQEVVSLVGLGTRSSDMTRTIGTTCGFSASRFCQILSLRRDFNADSTVMVEALVSGARDWRFGNAVFSKLPLLPIGGAPPSRTVVGFPIFRSGLYQGTRDTEERGALLVRVVVGDQTIGVFGVHLSTLRGERGAGADADVQRDARKRRRHQASALATVVHAYRAAHPRDRVIVLGDFNEFDNGAESFRVLEDDLGLVRVQTENVLATHIALGEAVDYIFVDSYLAGRLGRAAVVDEPNLPEASDHRPVLIDLDL